MRERRLLKHFGSLLTTTGEVVEPELPEQPEEDEPAELQGEEPIAV